MVGDGSASEHSANRSHDLVEMADEIRGADEAGDLDVLLSRLGLRGVVLAGFAMGTGEVARYLAAHGPGPVKDQPEN